MSGKSRRRGRHLPQTKKKKSGRGVRAPVAQAPAAVKPAEATPRAEVSPPAVKAPAPRTVVTPTFDVGSELRRIGLLGGIMLAILVVLYFVL